MIVNYLQECVKKIESAKQAQVNAVKEKVTREIIVPHNAELDKARNLAIQELTEKFNKQVAELQEQFNRNKQFLIDKGEEEKRNFAETTIASEIAVKSVDFDNAIADLNKQIEKYTIKE